MLSQISAASWLTTLPPSLCAARGMADTNSVSG